MPTCVLYDLLEDLAGARLLHAPSVEDSSFDGDAFVSSHTVAIIASRSSSGLPWEIYAEFLCRINIVIPGGPLDVTS